VQPEDPGAGFDGLEVRSLPAGTVLFSWEACAVFLGWIAYCTAGPCLCSLPDCLLIVYRCTRTHSLPN